jgi:hypothetical protein
MADGLAALTNGLKGNQPIDFGLHSSTPFKRMPMQVNDKSIEKAC